MSNVKTSSGLIPIPNAYVNTQPFWNAAKKGKLVLQYCLDSGQFQHYPRPVSIYTGKANLEWREVSGKVKVYAFTVTRSPAPGFEERVPYIVATVELDEGVRILSNILNCSPEDMKIHMAVKLRWEKLGDAIMYPAFEPDR